MNIYNCKDLDDYLALHGQDPNITMFELNDKVLNTVQELASIEIPKLEGINIKYISKRDLKNYSKFFINRHFKVHDVGVVSDSKLIRLLHNKNINSYQKVIDYYNDSAKFISPYNIPIDYIKDDVFDGTLVTQCLIAEGNMFNNLLSELNLYFSKIELSKRPIETTTSCYIHELIHTQLESHKGIVNNFYNVEVLSVFMELLYQLERKNYNNYLILLTTRVNNIIKSFNSMYTYTIANDESINKFSYFSNSKYLISILEAFNLLDLYIHSNKEIRNEIIRRIQKVFDGDRYLEEFLDSVDINIDNSLDSNIFKRLIKKTK